MTKNTEGRIICEKRLEAGRKGRKTQEENKRSFNKFDFTVRLRFLLFWRVVFCVLQFPAELLSYKMNKDPEQLFSPCLTSQKTDGLLVL